MADEVDPGGANSPSLWERALGRAYQLQGIDDRQRIAAWPFSGPILLAEETIRPIDDQPAQQYHLVDQWAWYGCFATAKRATATLEKFSNVAFDRDAYRLIYSALFKGRVGLLDARDHQLLVNPILAARQVPS